MARPRVLEPQDLISIQAALAAGLAPKQLVYRLGIERTTLWRFCNRVLLEGNGAAAVSRNDAPCDANRPLPRS